MNSSDTAEKTTYIVKKYVRKGGGTGAAYFLGMIGAAVYYIQNAASFGDGVIGLLKALVWPAFLVHHLFQFLNMY